MATKTKNTDNIRAYLFKGDDEYQRQRRYKKLLGSLISEDFADFDLELVEGDSATADRVMTGLSMSPLGSARRVVVIRHANKMNPDEQTKLATRLEQIPESGCLILMNPAAEKVDGKPRKGSEVIGDLSKAVRKVGEVVEFGKMKADGAITFAKSLFESARKKADAQAVAALVQRVGTDSAVIATEVQKLIAYAGDAKQITMEDVTAVTSETPEEKIFKLIDAVGARNQSEALKFVDELFTGSSDPDADAPKALATIARHFRLLWQTRLLVESRVGSFSKEAVPEEVASLLPSDPNVLDIMSRQPWMIKRLTPQARLFTRKELTRCLSLLARADLMLKGIEGGVEDPRMVMEILVIELAKPATRR